jgi:F-type H+-transporting ATPase subunit b
MNLDPTTFIFEVINFLVLVWLLQRVLYKPVLRAVNARQERIQKGLDEAAQAKAQALQLKAEYETRLSEWEHEQSRLLLALDEELKAERERQLKLLQKLLGEERKKDEALQERALQDKMNENERKALALAGEFAARLLTRLACEQLEQKLCELFFEDLESKESKLIETLQAAIKDGQHSLHVQTAMPLSAEQQAIISEHLRKLVGAEVKCEFTQDRQLLAGIAVDAGTLVLHADLQHELNFFLESTNGLHR